MEIEKEEVAVIIPPHLKSLVEKIVARASVDEDEIVDMVHERIEEEMEEILDDVCSKLADAIKPMITQELIRKFLR